MGLPVSALTDLELIHYAAVDDGAQAELARRCGTYDGLSLYDRIADLEAEVSYLQVQQDDDALCSCDDSDNSGLQDCINRVWEALKDHEGMDPGKLSEAVAAALGEMADFHSIANLQTWIDSR